MPRNGKTDVLSQVSYPEKGKKGGQPGVLQPATLPGVLKECGDGYSIKYFPLSWKKFRSSYLSILFCWS